MADERPWMSMDVPDFVREAEEAMARGETLGVSYTELTIKFGKGLVGDPFTSRNGKELVEVSIPNPDKADTRPWETFVISPKMIHENKFGKGVWMNDPPFPFCKEWNRRCRSADLGTRDQRSDQCGAEGSDGILQG